MSFSSSISLCFYNAPQRSSVPWGLFWRACCGVKNCSHQTWANNSYVSVSVNLVNYSPKLLSPLSPSPLLPLSHVWLATVSSIFSFPFVPLCSLILLYLLNHSLEAIILFFTSFFLLPLLISLLSCCFSYSSFFLIYLFVIHCWLFSQAHSTAFSSSSCCFLLSDSSLPPWSLVLLLVLLPLPCFFIHLFVI